MDLKNAVTAIERELQDALRRHEGVGTRQNFILAEAARRRRAYEDALTQRFMAEAAAQYEAEYPTPTFAAMAARILDTRVTATKAIDDHVSRAIPAIEDPEQRAKVLADMIAHHEERKAAAR